MRNSLFSKDGKLLGNHPKSSFDINEKKRISLHPSIDRTVGCKSHFWVRKGKIIWG